MLANNTSGNAVRTEERTEVERLLRESAQRALALDPSELQGRAALDAIDVQRWYWSTVRAPSAQQLTTIFQPAAVWVQAWKGDVASVLPASERWAEIDPNINAPFLNLGVLYAYAGDRDASDRMLRRATRNQSALGPPASVRRLQRRRKRQHPAGACRARAAGTDPRRQPAHRVSAGDRLRYGRVGHLGQKHHRRVVAEHLLQPRELVERSLGVARGDCVVGDERDRQTESGKDLESAAQRTIRPFAIPA